MVETAQGDMVVGIKRKILVRKRCHFYDDICAFLDWKTSKVISMGKLKGSLYVLDSKCFNQNGELCVNSFNDVSESLLFSAKNAIVSKKLLFYAKNITIDTVVWHS